MRQTSSNRPAGAEESEPLFRSRGIVLTYHSGEDPAWAGSIAFCDQETWKHAGSEYVRTQGHVFALRHVRWAGGHLEAIEEVIDELRLTAQRMGIAFEGPTTTRPRRMTSQKVWQDLIREQTVRLGWRKPGDPKQGIDPVIPEGGDKG